VVRQLLTALETIPPVWGMGQVQTGEPSWGFMKGLPAAPFFRPGALLPWEGNSHGGLVRKISGRISGDQHRH
jgi:hypothetical protein